jgi:ubiquinone/menaquinone biosynthesis C-methylase UbiE
LIQKAGAATAAVEHGALVHRFKVSWRDLRKRWKYFRNRPLRESNRRLAIEGAPDGWPLPPPFHYYKTSSKFDLRLYLQSSALGVAVLEEVLAANGLKLDQFRSILDWGSGCGRMVRALSRRTDAKLHGCDYNAALVRWCAEALPCADWKVCGLAPPLPYPDRSFDLVFAISVLTHIPTEMQVDWLTEIRRVLRPGGYALLSVHGASRTSGLPDEVRRRFDAGEHVVVGEEYAGTNLCGSYHPAAYVRDVLGKVMPLVAHLPDAARDSLQDFLLFRRA